MNMKKSMVVAVLTGLAAVATMACAGQPGRDEAAASQTLFSDKALAEHIRILASDEFGGRGPASKGEELTVKYLSGEFGKLGLKPAFGDSYVQEVPMAKITNDPRAVLRITGKGVDLSFRQGPQFVGWTARTSPDIALMASDVVFVGYGAVAPEWNWDDYAGMDVRGKTVIVLVNDPGFGSGDPGLFKGRTMTYYGRWPYKYEEAARHGAAGVLLVHETEAASYGWAVVNNSWMGTRYTLVGPEGNASRCALESWITLDTAKAIFAAAGMDYGKMKMAAVMRGFKAVPLKLKASISMHDAVENVVTRNIGGLLPGTKRPDEVIVYSAHWDHLGINPAAPGPDKIFNGAADNASGVSGLIELARAFAAPGVTHERSVLFLSTAAEEQGIFGAQYYTEHPAFPLNKTVADLNMDVLNLWGPTRDIIVSGFGQNDLEDYLKEAAAVQSRVVVPESDPQAGGYFRSDHFAFARAGVPAVTAGSGVDDVEKGREYGARIRREWAAAHYHQPSDEFSPDWNFKGAIQDLDVYYQVGLRLCNGTEFPVWKQGSEFKARREAIMGK